MNCKTIFTLLSVLGLSLASCEDEFDINKLHENPQLLVYCFPTEGDSTVVAVFSTVPVDTRHTSPDKLAGKALDAHIIYKVNGNEQPVRRITEEDAARLSIDPDHPAKRLVGQYCAVAPQKGGDRIDVEVRAEGVPTAWASTDIPERVEAKIDTVIQNVNVADNYYYGSTFNRMNATFHDDGATDDYYMVRIDEKRMAGTAIGSGGKWGDEFQANDYESYREHKDDFTHWDFSQLKWRCHYDAVETSNEPVLQNHSPIDDDFGFDYYDYADMAYFFNDQLFNGHPYTLHLDIFCNLIYSYENYYYTLGYWDEFVGGYSHTLQFYKLTKEYYRFLKSKNDIENNDWASNGIMPVTPLYTNVHGGLGIVAGYAVCSQTWWIEVEEHDGIYTDENK